MDRPGDPLTDLWGFVVPDELRDTWLAILEARKTPSQVVELARPLCGKSWKTATPKEVIGDCQRSVFALCYWLGISPTWQQAMLLYLVQCGHLKVACKSGQGPGKTKTGFVITVFWTIRKRGAMTLVNGPKMEQLKNGFLAEGAKVMKKAHPVLRSLVRVTKSCVYLGTKNDEHNWRILPITAADAAKLQGKHNENMNLLVDEASGVNDDIFETLEGTVSNTQSAFTPDAQTGCAVLLGNPNTSAGYFYETFYGLRSRNWVTLTFNAEESPIVNQVRVREFEQIYGRASNFYRVRVLGEFPLGDANAIVLEEDFAACCQRDEGLRQAALSRSPRQKVLSIDFARRGGDECVCVVRQGGLIVQLKVFPRTPDFEPVHAIRWAMARQKDLGWTDRETTYVIDAVGMGQGLAYPLIEAGKEVFEFSSGSSATGSRADKFANMASEAWFQVGRMFQKRLVHVPLDEELRQQLTARRWMPDLDNRGRFRVEGKKDYRKRTGQGSPDRADALVMALYQGAVARAEHLRGPQA